MSPEQLRRLAEKLERGTPLPRMDQDPAEYVVNRTAHELVRCLRELADEDET